MAKQTVKPENAPAKIRALREEIAKLKASMAELEEEPVDHARAIARLEAGLEEIFDAPASQLIAETATQLRSPGETGWRESLQSLIAVGVPETLHRGTRPELFGLLLSRALRDMIRAEIGRSAEGINDPRRAKTREDLAARLDAAEREEELAIRECELASLEELGPVEPGDHLHHRAHHHHVEDARLLQFLPRNLARVDPERRGPSSMSKIGMAVTFLHAMPVADRCRILA
jgi:hypothetical protein